MSKRKTKPRKTASIKPIKIGALIITAIQSLSESIGSTPGKIIDYITLTSELPQSRVKSQVKSALKKGVEYGVLKKFRGRYFLPTSDHLTRADRIATRFARLSTPINSNKIYKTINLNGLDKKKLLKTRSPLNDQIKPNLNPKKNVRKARSMPLSLTSTATGKSYYHDRKSFSFKK